MAEFGGGDEALASFLHDTYAAAADLASWDRESPECAKHPDPARA